MYLLHMQDMQRNKKKQIQKNKYQEGDDEKWKRNGL